MQDLLTKYRERLSNLKLNANSNLWTTATHYQAPHKPLLLLCVFDMYAGETQPVNAIRISSELNYLFSIYWSIVIPGKKRQSPHSYSLPFYHLSTEEEAFWHLLPIPGKEAELSEAQKVMKLADAVRFSLVKLGQITLGARLDEPLHKLLCEETHRETLRKTVLDTYFANEIHLLLDDQSKNNILQCRLQNFSQAKFMNDSADEDLFPSKNNSLRGLPLRELTNVNTQVRRLAYFPALLGSAARQNYNYNSLAMRLQSWGKDHQEDLKNHLNTTGNVVPQMKPKKPRLPSERASHASKRYVDFAENVGWLNQISGLYTITRTGRVLLTAQDENSAAENNQQDLNNPFELDDIQKLFFITELWRKDCDVLFTIFNLLSLYPTHLKKLQEQFGAAYREHLEEKNKFLLGEREKRVLRERLNNIKTWTNPARYAEQFIPTRMNWLLDLGLVAISPTGRRECQLTFAGINFKSRLPGMTALGDEWINGNFFKSVASCFTASEPLEKWSDTSEHKKKLINCLRAAFKRLRRPPVPKFSVSQVISFVCLMMAVGEDIVIDYNDVLQALSTPVQVDNDHAVELRRAARENESYLILNPI